MKRQHRLVSVPPEYYEELKRIQQSMNNKYRRVPLWECLGHLEEQRKRQGTRRWRDDQFFQF